MVVPGTSDAPAESIRSVSRLLLLITCTGEGNRFTEAPSRDSRSWVLRLQLANSARRGRGGSTVAVGTENFALGNLGGDKLPRCRTPHQVRNVAQLGFAVVELQHSKVAGAAVSTRALAQEVVEQPAIAASIPQRAGGGAHLVRAWIRAVVHLAET